MSDKQQLYNVINISFNSYKISTICMHSRREHVKSKLTLPMTKQTRQYVVLHNVM